VYYNANASILRAVPLNTLYARRYLQLSAPTSSPNGVVLFTQASVSYTNTSVGSVDLVTSAQAFLTSQGLSFISVCYTNDTSTLTSLGWYYQNGSLIAPFVPRLPEGILFDLAITNNTYPLPRNYISLYKNAMSNGLTYVRAHFSNGYNITQTVIPSSIYRRRMLPYEYVVNTGSISGSITALGPRINNVGPFNSRHQNPNSYVIFRPDASGNFNASFYFKIPTLKQELWSTLELIAEGNVYMASSSNWNNVWYDQGVEYFNTQLGFMGTLSQAGKWNYWFAGWSNAVPTLIDPYTGVVAYSVSVTNATSPLYVDLLTLRIGVNNPHANPHAPVFK
jgi:hypothetical protein